MVASEDSGETSRGVIPLVYWRVAADHGAWVCAGCGESIEVGRAARIDELKHADGKREVKVRCQRCAWPEEP